MSTPLGCVFDAVIAGATPADMVLEEDDLVAFLDIRPLFPGHTLVVPRVHYATVADLPAGLAGRLWDAGARVAAAQRAALGAAGTFFGLNDVVSQSVPHVHLHVVPRRPRDGLRGFFWPRTRYPGPDDSAAVAEALRRHLGAGTPPPAATPPSATPPSAATVPAATLPAATTPPVAAAPAVSIRAARPDDEAAVAALLAAGTLRAAEDPAGGPGYRAALAEIAADPRSEVLVAEAAGEVVGMCQLIVFRHVQERGGLCAELESVHVAPSQRSRGIGGALVEEAVARARRAGCYRVQLTSNKARSDAHRFYLRHGFDATHDGFKRYL